MKRLVCEHGVTPKRNCKQCNAAYSRRWYAAHKDKATEWKRHYYAMHPDYRKRPIAFLVEKFKSMGLSEATAEAFVVDGDVLDVRMKQLKKEAK